MKNYIKLTYVIFICAAWMIILTYICVDGYRTYNADRRIEDFNNGKELICLDSKKDLHAVDKEHWKLERLWVVSELALLFVDRVNLNVVNAKDCSYVNSYDLNLNK